MKIVTIRCPVYNTIWKQIEYKDFTFMVNDDCYNFPTANTAVDFIDYERERSYKTSTF